MTMQTLSTFIPRQAGGPYTGWSVGGGVDYALNDWVSARADIRYRQSVIVADLIVNLGSCLPAPFCDR
jgi:long-subunit fatty acid transport protein